jgi:hypothetical protein
VKPHSANGRPPSVAALVEAKRLPADPGRIRTDAAGLALLPPGLAGLPDASDEEPAESAGVHA